MGPLAGAHSSTWLKGSYAREPATLAEMAGGERPGSSGARRLLAVARGANTARKYERRLQKWFEFCELGYGGQPYDPDVFSLTKWWLFAGWMLEPANNLDKDLNTVRSAMNRYFEDIGGQRVVLGHSVRVVIQKFKVQMEDQKRQRGEEVGLNREPCEPEAFVKIMSLCETATGLLLKQAMCQLLQLLGWFRADTLTGFQPGDVYFSTDGWLNILVRKVKMQPERQQTPAHLTVPPGDGPDHWRSRALAAMRRADALVPGWYTYITALMDGVSRTDGAAAALMTTQLRAMLTGTLSAAQLARTSSHSWREMAAVSTSRAGGCLFKMMTRGLWRRVDTMMSNYIEPFGYFPFVPMLAELYDDLQPGGRYEAGIRVRSDGRETGRATGRNRG